MKKLFCCSCLMFSLVALPLHAAVSFQYWDINGATAGAGGATPSGTWNTTTANFNAASDGTGPAILWVQNSDAVFSAGNDATGTYNITHGVSITANSVLVKNGKVAGQSGTLTIAAGGLTVNNGATYSMSGSANLLPSGASMVTLDGGTLENRTAPAGSTFLNAGFSLVLGAGGGTLNCSAAAASRFNLPQIISGTGSLTLSGAGSAMGINGTSTYSGNTTINTPMELRLFASGAAIPSGTALTLSGATAVFNCNSFPQTVASLSGSGIVACGNTTFTVNGPASTTFSGTIQPSFTTYGATSRTLGSVTKAGSGTLTLSGANSYGGILTLTAGGITVNSGGSLCGAAADVTVNGGTLTLNNAAQTIENLTGNGGTINLTGSHVLTINPAASSTYSGLITGSGGITKTGTSTETLSAANTYSGPTTVSAGKLVVTPLHAGGGKFSLANSATLGVVMSSPGTMQIGDLTIGNSTMEFDFVRSSPAAPIINSGSTNIVTLNGTAIIDLKNFNTPGTVTLLKYSGAIQGTGSFALGQVPPHMAVTLSNDTVNSQLIISATALDPIRWIGDATSLWNINNGSNTVWQSVNGATSTYYQETTQGDTVRFDDNATSLTTVTLTNTVTPFNMAVDNSVLPYTFTGAGTIAGALTLTKDGSADLSIGTSNTYTGGTLFNAGTLSLGNNFALGTGKLTASGTAIRSDSGTARTVSVPVDVNNDLTLGSAAKNGDLTFSGAWKLLGASRQFNVDTITAAINGVISQDVSGRVFTKTGNGTLDLGGANTFSGGFNHNAGTVRVNSNNALGAANTPVSFASGVTLATTAATARSLTYPFTLNGDLTLGQASGGTAALTMAGSVDLGGATRTINVANASDVISAVITNGGMIKTGGTLDLSGANTFSGGFSLSSGTVRVNNNTALGAVNSSVSLADGVTLATTTTSARTLTNNFSIGGNITLGQVSGGTAALTLAGVVDFGGVTRTITVANASDTISAPISNGGLTKAGTGTLILSGLNNFTGDTTVSDGALQVNTSSLSGNVVDNAAMIFSQTTNGLFNGIIHGTGTLTKTGAGTVTLTNNDDYTGVTTVTAGGLLINGSNNSPIAVTNALLGGSGTVFQSATVSNVTLAPGDNTVANTIGQLKFSTNLVASGTNQWELGALKDDADGTAGVDFDQITVGGTFDTNAPFVIALNFTNSALAPDFAVPFWQSAHKWTVVKMNGGTNLNSAGFASVQTNAYYYADNFSTAVEADGSLSLSYTPSDATAPIILAQPADKSVVLGGTTNLTVSATGTAPLSYQWYFNSNPVGTGTSSLTFDPATLSDNGSYFVVVANASGSVTSAVATLTVIEPPAIATQPQDQAAVVGGTATFTVSATGTSLSYLWQKNGSNISGATNSSYNTPILQLTDSGNLYSVVVTNLAGSVVSSTATLTIIDPPSIVTQSADQTVLLGASNVTFSVTATGSSLLSYQWKKDGFNIGGETNSFFTIATVTANDAAAYSVVVTNLAGSVISSNATLTVIIPPTIVTQPADQSVVSGASNVTFSVTVSGSLPLGYQWQKDGSDIGDATNSFFTISVATTNDVAAYSVVVTNLAGSVVSSNATLTVIVPPSIDTQPADQTVALGATNVTFSVTVSGSLPLVYQWQKDGSDITDATNSVFTIATVTTNDVAAYSVVVTNLAGSAVSSNATLTVIVPPAIVTQPADQTVQLGATNVSFSVTATGSLLSYQWKKDGFDIGGATNSIITIATVTTTDAATYSVVITNLAGSIVSSNAVLTVTTPEAPAPTASLSVTNDIVTLVWDSVAGRTYQPQVNVDLSTTNWLDLVPPVVATGPVSSVTNSVAGTNAAFYRVILLP